MDPGHTLDAVWDPGPGQPPARLIGDKHVVMGFGPIDPYKDHPRQTSFSDRPTPSLEAASSPLMDQCSQARHPTSHHGNLTDQQGHDLAVRLQSPASFSAHLLAAQRPASP